MPADARFQAPPEHRDPPAEVEPVAMRGGLGEKEARDTALAAAPGKPAGYGGATTGPRNVEASASYDENPPPVYPRIARRRGLEGEVWLRVRVSPMGSVLEAEVERSSSHEILDKAALEAVLRWRFLPARLGDTPVEGVVRVPIRFELLPPG
ncbi:MAG: energy transducer TonB [Deferrisomatales bacterium]|nr:energy transducer TonB [Deferrisomatales bacterium]